MQCGGNSLPEPVQSSNLSSLLFFSAVLATLKMSQQRLSKFTVGKREGRSCSAGEATLIDSLLHLLSIKTSPVQQNSHLLFPPESVAKQAWRGLLGEPAAAKICFLSFIQKNLLPSPKSNYFREKCTSRRVSVCVSLYFCFFSYLFRFRSLFSFLPLLFLLPFLC